MALEKQEEREMSDAEPIKMPARAELPHTNKQLAQALGYCESAISMMFRAGMPKDIGGSRASLKGALQWLKTNEFNYERARAMPPVRKAVSRAAKQRKRLRSAAPQPQGPHAPV